MSDDNEELELSLSLDDDLSLEPQMPPVSSAPANADPQMPELSLEPLDKPVSEPATPHAAIQPVNSAPTTQAEQQNIQPVAPQVAPAPDSPAPAPTQPSNASPANPVAQQQQVVQPLAAENLNPTDKAQEPTPESASAEAAAALAPVATKKTILAIKIKNKAALYGAYMPFLKGGGLFVPTRQNYNLGDLVHLRMELVEMHETIDVSGVVAWITPAAAQGNRAAGIGVQFTSENAIETVGKIERELAGLLMTDHPTHTM